MSSRRRDLVAVLGLVLFALLVHSEQVFGGSSFYTEDVRSVFGPSRWVVADFLRSGEIPFWNPLSFGGAPLLGNPENAVFYPFTVIFLLLPLVPALKASLVFHTALCALFAYLCFRVTFKAGPLGAFLGAAVFAFSSYYPHHVVHHRDVVAVPWIPLAFLLADRAFAWRGRRSLAAAGGLALVMATLFFGGAPQTTVFAGSLIATFVLWRTVALVLDRRSGEAWRGAALAVAGLAIGAGISAVQVLPTTTLVSQSFRTGGVSWHFASYLSLNPAWAATTLGLPHALGRWGDGWWGRWPMHETILYVGILPLLLWVVAFRARRTLVGARFLTLVAALSLLLAFGKWTPLFRLVYEFVPGYDSFRGPARFTLLFCFALAGLTALGVEAIGRGLRDARRTMRALTRWSAVAGGLLAASVGVLVLAPGFSMDVGLRLARLVKGDAVYAERKDLYESAIRWILDGLHRSFSTDLAWQAGSVAIIVLSIVAIRRALRGGRAWTAALAVVLMLDLFFFSLGAPFRKTIPNADVNRRTPLVGFLTERADGARIDERLSPTVKWNRNVPFRLRAVDGRNLSIYPMKRYGDFLPGLDTDHPALLDMMRVRFLVRGRDESPPDGYPLVFADGGERVYENRDILPPAWLVSTVRLDSDLSRIVESTRDPDFDPRVEAWVESDAALPAAGVAGGFATLEFFSAHEVRYLVQADGPSLLVTSERWYPGWTATVDGREAEVHPVNGILRGVKVDRDDREVVFRYREERFAAGLAICLGSIAVALLLLLVGVLPRRRS